MGKSQIIKEIATQIEIDRRKASFVVDIIIDSIIEALVNGKKVTFAGFGTFKNVYKEARNAKHPKTGEDICVEAKNCVIFKPGKILRNRVSKKHL